MLYNFQGVTKVMSVLNNIQAGSTCHCLPDRIIFNITIKAGTRAQNPDLALHAQGCLMAGVQSSQQRSRPACCPRKAEGACCLPATQPLVPEHLLSQKLVIVNNHRHNQGWAA